MAILDALKGWTSTQKHVVAASYLGWTLDAFDFFLMVFVIKDVAAEFGAGKTAIAWATTLTLALRPLGAFLFGRLADRFGRRPVLMADVAIYSVLGFATAFSPNLVVFLVIRALFGIAMGGEWGTGASLTMETVKPEARGLVSGLLQSGYPTGYLLASIVYRNFYDVAALARHVPCRDRSGAADPLHPPPCAGIAGLVARACADGNGARRARQALEARALRHRADDGVQLLQPRHAGRLSDLPAGAAQFDAHTTGNIAILYNIGAILGGWVFGLWSQSFGRRRTIIVAALLSIPVAGSGPIRRPPRCSRWAPS